jgi:ketosteroid isomerase-like protein
VAATGNEEPVLAFADAITRQDVEAAVAVCHPEVEFSSMLDVNGRRHYGHEGIRQYFEDVASAWEEWRAEVHRLVAAADGRVAIVMTMHVRGRESGAMLSERAGHIWTLRDGLLFHNELYRDPEEALRVLGVEPSAVAERPAAAEPPAVAAPPAVAEPPATRASDAEREATATRLRTAAGEGRLTLDELADRLESAFGAVTRAELEPLTADLPEQAPPVPALKARRWIVGIMGGATYRGRWRIAERCTVVNVMGGADVDLTRAIVEGAETEITVFSLMGGSDVVVPDGVHVELTGFAVMGGNDLRLEDAAPPAPGAPVVRVRAYSLMGGTDVKLTRKRGTRPALRA